jgi:glycosyltransferase involved in cell wall biosynthesis
VNKIAIIIKTYNRHQQLIDTISSIRNYCNVIFRLYILEDGPISHEHRQLLIQLEDEGHYVRIFDNPVGTNKARNEAIDNLRDEAFVLRIDDDFEFTAETDIAKMAQLLTSIPDLGVLGDLEIQKGKGKGLKEGRINDRYGNFAITDTDLLISMIGKKNIIDVEKTAYGKVFVCDLVRNFLLIKRQVFEDIRWDENIFFNKEHEDFLLTIKRSNWRVGFTDQSFHYHNEKIIKSNGIKIRPDSSLYANDEIYFKNKWKVEKIRVIYPLRKRLFRKLKSLLR